MVREHRVESSIGATPAQVWQVLSDLERWPEWTASMSRLRWLDGSPRGPGGRVWVKQPRLLPGTWTVTDWRADHGFAWQSSSPGLRITGEHWIAPADAGCRVTLALRFQGLLAAPIMALGGGLIRRYMALEAEGLKARSENRR